MPTISNPGETVRTLRLDLPLMPLALLDALIASDRFAAQRVVDYQLADELFAEQRDDREFLAMRRQQMIEEPSWAPWLLRAIVLRSENRMVGYVNFHGPPGINDTSTPDAAELGFEIFPSDRNHGFASECARALMAWAQDSAGVMHFIAGIAPDNQASMQVHAQLGFVATGLVVDGECIFECRVGA